jgi:hypothetical protein
MSHQDEHLPLFKSPLLEHASQDRSQDRQDGSLSSTSTQFVSNDDEFHNTPQFHRHTQATNLELFYDLFFVANLTDFTSVHEVNSKKTLTQYLGFFCILWFSWYQMAVYDVWFSMDSCFERIAKCLRFGVMIGLASISPKFAVGEVDEEGNKDHHGTYRTL